MIDPRNWRFVNPQNKQVMSGPILDMAALDQPPDPFYLPRLTSWARSKGEAGTPQAYPT